MSDKEREGLKCLKIMSYFVDGLRYKLYNFYELEYLFLMWSKSYEDQETIKKGLRQ